MENYLLLITCRAHYILKELNFYHIGPTRPKLEYSFEMLTLYPKEENRDRIQRLKVEVVNIEDCTYPSSIPLYVSYDYFKAGRLSMQIRISKTSVVESKDNP